MNKLMRILNSLYLIFCINFLFILTNIFFFQALFMFDFKPVFFPVYCLASILLLPSTKTVFSCLSNISSDDVTGIVGKYFRKLYTLIQEDYKAYIPLCVTVYLSTLSLYVVNDSIVFGDVLFILNFIFLIIESIVIVIYIYEINIRSEKFLLLVSIGILKSVVGIVLILFIFNKFRFAMIFAVGFSLFIITKINILNESVEKFCGASKK